MIVTSEFSIQPLMGVPWLTMEKRLEATQRAFGRDTVEYCDGILSVRSEEHREGQSRRV